jgi:tetratricopeptide (TPR) repeat protein
MNNDNLNKTLVNYINDPKYPLYNFTLGRCYEDLGQNASALSFYLRAAELSVNGLLTYESVLRMALCIEKIGNRVYSLKGVILRAISLMPKRPEAYFIMSRVCEWNKDWHDAYTFAVIGETLIEDNDEKLMTDVGYPGQYGFVFERAVTAWWIGLYDESIHLCRQLEKDNTIQPVYMDAIKNNIANFGYLWKRELRYDQSMYHELRVKFPGASEIKQNYSQCFQDLFVLMMLKGKIGGGFLEIGCGNPVFSNNTYLLEKQFDWTGVSIDIDKTIIDKFKETRPDSEVICQDATKIDFVKLIGQVKTINYLQIDCDPAIVSFQVLQRIPFETTKFAVITFEHDNFCDEHKEIKERSRKYLESFGYVMVVNNISEDRFSDFEDWWVHPDLVDKNILERMMCISDNPKKADDYILNRI